MKALKRCFSIRNFITLAENFGKWRPYLELFWEGGGTGAEISLGPRPPPPPAPSSLGTAPVLNPRAEALMYQFFFPQCTLTALEAELAFFRRI